MISAMYANLKAAEEESASYSQTPSSRSPEPVSVDSQMQDLVCLELRRPEFQQPPYGPSASLAEEALTMKALEQQRNQLMSSIYEQAEQHRQVVRMHIEHQVQQMEMTLAEDFAEQVRQAKQQYKDRRSEIEKHATLCVAETQSKPSQAKLSPDKETAKERAWRLRSEQLCDCRQVSSATMSTDVPPSDDAMSCSDYTPSVVDATSGLDALPGAPAVNMARSAAAFKISLQSKTWKVPFQNMAAARQESHLQCFGVGQSVKARPLGWGGSPEPRM